MIKKGARLKYYSKVSTKIKFDHLQFLITMIHEIKLKGFILTIYLIN